MRKTTEVLAMVMVVTLFSGQVAYASGFTDWWTKPNQGFRKFWTQSVPNAIVHRGGQYVLLGAIPLAWDKGARNKVGNFFAKSVYRDRIYGWGYKKVLLPVGRTIAPEWYKAESALKNGDYDRAITLYTKLIRNNSSLFFNPKSKSDQYYNRGLAHYNKGNPDQAVSDWNEAISLNDKNDKAYVARGAIAINKENYDQGISDCTKAIEINSRNTVAYYDRAIAYYEKGEYEKAWGDIQKAVGLGYSVNNPRLINALQQKLGIGR